ncbi:hypothetical protein AX16_004928 [Volvariella volvacea WC 439]|nr:hypothetical protein AX16_004928 [Volvariella volvacea WC 439]
MPDFDVGKYFQGLEELMDMPQEDKDQWVSRLAGKQRLVAPSTISPELLNSIHASQTSEAKASHSDNDLPTVNAAPKGPIDIGEGQAPPHIASHSDPHTPRPQLTDVASPQTEANLVPSIHSHDFESSLPALKRKAQEESKKMTTKRSKQSHSSRHEANLDDVRSAPAPPPEGDHRNGIPDAAMLGVPLAGVNRSPLPSPMGLCGSLAPLRQERAPVAPDARGITEQLPSSRGPRRPTVDVVRHRDNTPESSKSMEVALPAGEDETSLVTNARSGHASDEQTAPQPIDEDQAPLASPIEDLTDDVIEVPPNPGVLQAGASKLSRELKQRIAQHTAAKRRAKVVDLGNTLRVPEVSDDNPGDDHSVIEVSSSPSNSRPPSPRRSRTAVLVPQATKGGVNSRQVQSRKPEVGKAGKQSKSKAKEKSPLILPADYVRTLRDKVADGSKKGLNAVKFLEGMNIVYIGGDMNFASQRTRKRMDLIVKHGGNLLPEYDPSIVTHIVTDAPRAPTLRALGLKRLEQIPDHIPTVKWDWVLFGIGKVRVLEKEQIQARMEDVWLHAAFSERFDAGTKKSSSSAKGKNKAKEAEKALEPSHAEDFSRISEFTPDKRSIMGSKSSSDVVPDNSPHAPLYPPQLVTNAFGPSGSKVTDNTADDPLAEFYAQARAEAEYDSGSDEEEADESGIIVPSKGQLPKRGFTCDNKERQNGNCVNQDIIDKLEELMELHKAKPTDEDRWRVYSYGKCIRALRNHPQRIKSLSEARSIRGVGEKTAQKIMEILETGDLKRIEHERTDDVQVTKLLQGIYGVGRSTAFKWYANGIRTLDDLVSGSFGIRLTPAQEIGLKYYDDVNSRMPREEAKAIFESIKPIALGLDPDLFIEIMGSYRRGKKDCGDIDILITRNPADGRTHAGILRHLLPLLHDAGILMDDLALPEDPNDLEVIYRGLCRLPHVAGSRRRRIDFLTVPWQSRGAALLYYTFNRAMRLKANVLGYSLNQRGLFAGVVRDPHDRRVKLNTGSIIASETEEEIFKILGVPWQEPHERVRG